MKREELPAVDVHNDLEMIREGIRVPNRIPRDKSVWEKTDKEKKELKRLRNIDFNLCRSWTPQDRTCSIPCKLIVTTSGYDKTTFSYNCTMSEAKSIVGRFLAEETKTEGKKKLKKYAINGITYPRGQFPFWYGRY